MKKIARITSYVLLLVGFAIFFMRGDLFGDKYEVPLGEVKGFIVDNEKNIYIGCGFYDRVQVYDENGIFVRNWKVPAKGGDFTINFSKDENISILTRRSDEQIVYNKKGKIINRNSIDPESYKSTERDWRKFRTKDKNIYEIKGNFLSRSIVINNEKTLISQNIWLQIINGPINNFSLIILGLVIGYSGKKIILCTTKNLVKKQVISH